MRSKIALFSDIFEHTVDTLESVIAWKPLADLNYPHAFMPAVGKIDGMIFVIGFGVGYGAGLGAIIDVADFRIGAAGNSAKTYVSGGS